MKNNTNIQYRQVGDYNIPNLVLPPEYDKAFFTTTEDLLKTVNETINFYDKLPEDMEKAFKSLLKFVFRLD